MPEHHVLAPLVQRSLADTWGWLPACCLCAASGMLLVAIAMTAARTGVAWIDWPFWLGLLLLYVPITVRLLGPEPQQHERVGLLVMLGVGLYAVKFMHSPQAFTLYDELLHWRAVGNMLETRRAFTPNSLLPISSLFPGLHNVTSELASLSGLSVFTAGVLVIAAARITMMLALYCFYKQISNSSFVAAIGMLIYSANPAFLYFNAQFAYESLALPMAALALFVQARLLHPPHRTRAGWYLALALAAGATIVTHHLTTYVLLALLLLWTFTPSLPLVLFSLALWYSGNIAAMKMRTRVRYHFGRLAEQVVRRTASMRVPGPARSTIAIGLASALWMFFVAQTVVQYLGSYAWNGVRQVFELITGEIGARRLFQGFAGEVAPAWEQFAGYAAVLLILFGLPFGLYSVLRRYSKNAAALALALGALAYPASQGLRLTDLGLQISGRAVEFLFVPVAFVLAVCVAEVRLPRLNDLQRRALLTLCITLVFVGGVILGWPRWARLPRPYLVAADTRSIEPQSLAAADWARTVLEPNQRIAADRVNGLLIGSYGQQYVVSLAYDYVNVPRIFFAPRLGEDEQAALEQGQIAFVVVDRRLSTALPAAGIYFELGEPDMNRHTTPIPRAALDKFDRLDTMRRIYDSGDIQIFEVEN